jgi:hypothetical protein
VVGVWRGLLRHLLEEPDSGRRQRLRSEADARLEAATRIAAVLTLTGAEQVVDRTVTAGLPSLADVFPLGNDRGLRYAAREACDVGPFLPTAEGGFRFAQRDVQDWLAAFGLAELKVVQLRSGLYDMPGGLSARHRDLLPLLRQVSTDAEVRAWIDGLGGGLPLPSDLISPTLTDSLAYIDRLEKVVVDESGLWFYGEQLRHLAAPGLGYALVQRLREPQRSDAVKDLLLDIARFTDPDAVLPVALDLVLDRNQSVALRKRALLVISQHGGDRHFRQLVQPVARTPATTAAEQQLQATVIRHFLERRLWTVAEAAAHVTPAEPGVVDDRQVVLHTLEGRMSAHDARAILCDRQRLRAGPRLAVASFRNRDLLQAALEGLLAEDCLDETDEGMLVDFTLEWQEQDGRLNPGFPVLQRLGSSAAVRRRFNEHGVELLRRDPTAGRIWSFALLPEDWRWLFDRLRRDWTGFAFGLEDLYCLGR